MKLQKCHTRRFVQAVGKLGINLISAVFIIILCLFLMIPVSLYAKGGCQTGFKNGTCNVTSDGSTPSCQYTDVNAAIGQVKTGDTVSVPSAGTCVWRETSAVYVNKSITLQGASPTQINVDYCTYNTPAISVSAANVIIKGFKFLMPVSGGFGIATSGANTRITENTFTSFPGYDANINTIYFNGVYGLVDNNVFENLGQGNETIWARGPSNSWQTANSMGLGSYSNGADNVFVENNTFSMGKPGQGYVSDCNSNSRCVFRYNTINGGIKIDAHGMASNGPPRSARHIEIYNNLWATTDDYRRAWELRGGTGRIFNNSFVQRGHSIYFVLQDYCYTAGSGYANCGSRCNCASDYPVNDQIGVGIDPKSAASEPMYFWGNTSNGSPATIITAQTGACQAACGSAYNDEREEVKLGRDYFVSTTKPATIMVGGKNVGYEPYTCPHPLAGLTGTCNSTIAGTAGYNVTRPMPPRNLGIK